MAKLNGKNILIYLDDTTDAVLTGQIDGSFEISNSAIEDTDKSDTHRSILGTTRAGGTLNVTVHADATDAVQDALRAACAAGTSVSLVRYVSGSEASAPVTCYVTNYTESAPQDDVVTATITLEIDGDPSAMMLE